MIWLAYTLPLVGALVLVLVVVGYRLPRDHVAARGVEVPAPPDRVFATIRDVAAWPSWRPSVKRVELGEPVDGKPSFVELGRQGKIPYVIDDERAPDARNPGRFTTRILDRGLPFGGRWIITVAPGDTPGTARVTVTERGFIKNPIFRVMAKTVFSVTSTMEAWLRDLGRHHGADVTPAAVEPAPAEAAS